MADDELLDAVLPEDPGGDAHRLARGGGAGVGQLLRGQGPRLSRCASRYVGHLGEDIEHPFCISA
jgi:hypothetical protein